ncbi:MAG: helix-turn-helix transcriptional regulator [Betaproteobacteria bacterium]|nr:helix-turn-helix transcriptional regulator [Betaproteobacteria bacterium]
MDDASKIRIFRALHGLGQVDFGHYMGADRPAVAKWEKGVYLPQPEEMQKIDIYNWIRAGSRLPSQLFVPLIPDLTIRPQAINHFLNTIRDLLPEFCTAESISADSVELFTLDDADILKLGPHVLFLFGAMKTIPGFIPDHLKPDAPKHMTGVVLAETIKTEADVKLILRRINCNEGVVNNIKCFRLKDVKWDGFTVLDFSLTIKNVDTALRHEIESLIEESIKKSIAARFESSNPQPIVEIKFQKVI